jgi:hypothetical protein
MSLPKKLFVVYRGDGTTGYFETEKTLDALDLDKQSHVGEYRLVETVTARKEVRIVARSYRSEKRKKR